LEVPVRVLFADKLPDQSRTRLAAAGFEVLAEPELSGDALADRLAEVAPDVLVVRSTKVSAAHVAACASLSLVVRAGAGVNTIDLEACSGAGVFVANCPGKNAVAVAELTFALLLAIDRHVVEGAVDLRAGRWNKGAYSKAEGLKGRTLGLLGFGGIGQAVARRARAFGMPVVAWSRSLTADAAAAAGVILAATPEEVARQADVLSVHLALTPETRGLVGESVFTALRHGSVVLNTSRAAVLDEDALLTALDARSLRAGLDVFSGEPNGKEGPFQHPLASHPRVVGSHHIGASTTQAQQSVGDEVCRIVEGFRDQGRVHNCVNTLLRSSADHRVVVRHRDRVGVLASILSLLREDAINVQEMENLVFPGGAAIARIQVSGRPSADLGQRLALVEHVLHASIAAIPE
jgi:D-3-phosphoglycerate dehydrogenase